MKTKCEKCGKKVELTKFRVVFSSGYEGTCKCGHYNFILDSEIGQ